MVEEGTQRPNEIKKRGYKQTEFRVRKTKPQRKKYLVDYKRIKGPWQMFRTTTVREDVDGWMEE